jgi:hypothetical protein
MSPPESSMTDAGAQADELRRLRNCGDASVAELIRDRSNFVSNN